ncbi:predicted protein [Botrytis cinerea T4]|uniref:Uncharacterized protein n=1 Tax=Botryotinia fuckeliana (strain T4) TaxID=999810 RepID=G2XS46_BOTF4|nr:predicted protein [Botrytis cinerea T4]
MPTTLLGLVSRQDETRLDGNSINIKIMYLFAKRERKKEQQKPIQITLSMDESTSLLLTVIRDIFK